ncbi:LapA family protein [Lacticaseibacillus saniviri]
MKRQQQLIVSLVLALILIVFALLNGQAVAVNFFGARFEWPLIIVIAVSVLIGALITFLMSTSALNTARKQLKSVQNDAQDQQKAVDQAVEKATAALEAENQKLKQQLDQTPKQN